MNFVKTLWAPLPRAIQDTGNHGGRELSPPRRGDVSRWHLLKPIVAYVGMVTLLAMGSLGSV